MGLKDRLSGRKLPSTRYSLRIDDDTAARAELLAARAAGDDTRIALAQEAVDACYEQVAITALPPGLMEALLEEHPPTAGQRERNKAVLFNPKTFAPALFAACIDSDVTEEDWTEYLGATGPMTAGESIELFNTVWELNYRAPDPDLGKG